jgi:ATP-dependent Clp protease ATP-binding subunit ClpC
MFERFTEQALRAMALSQEEGRRCGHNFVGTEHVLLGLIREATSTAAKTLTSFGVTLDAARVEVEKFIGRGSGFVALEIPFTPRTKRVLQFAQDERQLLGHTYLGTEHLLLGLLRERDGIAVKVLEVLKIDLQKVRASVIKRLEEDAQQQQVAL